MIIKKVKYIEEYILEITYEDETVKQYDFKKWLFTDINPMYQKFRKIENFKKVKPFDSMIIFGNDEMEFPDYQLGYFEIKIARKKASISARKKRVLLVK